jgi:predicted nucleic acid-binding protein
MVPAKLFSSEHVFDESVSLIARRANAVRAARWARDHLALREIVWLDATSEDFQEGIRILEKFDDQELSFTDCVSFALMRREGIDSAFGFDHHFMIAGFDLWPGLK